jgi:hypothetical protein
VSKQIFSKFQNFRSVLIYGSLNEILVVTSGIRARLENWSLWAKLPNSPLLNLQPKT